MQSARTPILAAALVAFAVSPAGAQSALDGYTPVTEARLRNPEPANWLFYRGTRDGWGYSPLDQIDATNVQNLVPVWSFSTGMTSGHQAPPIVNDGVMFISTPRNLVSVSYTHLTLPTKRIV